MPLSNVYILTLEGNNADRATRNVFQYYRNEVAFAPIDAIENLMNAFEDVYFGATASDLDGVNFHPAQVYNGISVYNLGDPTAFSSRSISYAGTATGTEQMPRFVAFGFRSNRKTRNIRRGQKRIAGVVETAANAGVVTPAFLSILDVIANRMGITITDPGDPSFTFDPIVVKRIKYTTPEGKTAYRFPETEEELEFFVADDWEVRTELTTQNSRKIGRGI